MSKHTRYLGLDVHADTIAVAIAEQGAEARSLATIPNRIEAVRKLVKKLGGPDRLRCCYEAGPCGYVLYWQLVQMGVHCEVVAPTLIPVKAGDRVKTDRRDARKLARCYRNGDLTPVWVPDAAHEALRDLVRGREAAKKDQRRARSRLTKLLLRHGCRKPQGMTAWAGPHRTWLEKQSLDEAAAQEVLVDYRNEVEHQDDRLKRLERSIDHAVEQAPAETRAVVQALQALRGIRKTTAVGLVAEVGKFSRFDRPAQLMGYSGAVPSENSSGGPGKQRRGAITKTGNGHIRKLITESAWSYRYQPRTTATLRKRQQGLSEGLKRIAWNAQVRLHRRYRHLSGRKAKPKAVMAVGRELLGFVWDIAVPVETGREQVFDPKTGEVLQ
jgi:transposase